MGMSKLTPTVVTDKNGRITTVHKKADDSAAKAPMFPPPIQLDNRVERRNNVLARIELILDSVPAPAIGVSITTTDRMSVEQLEAVEQLLDSAPSRLMANMIETRSVAQQGFLMWLKQMKDITTNTTMEITPDLGNAVAGVMELQEALGSQVSLSKEQVRALTQLSVVASDPEVDFNLPRFARSSYGRIVQHPDAYMSDLVMNHDEATVARAIDEIKHKRITRRSELDAFLEGELPSAMVSGVL